MKCDICKIKIKEEYVDGATAMGPWANMCLECHKTVGIGLGIGKGQKYNITMKELKSENNIK